MTDWLGMDRKKTPVAPDAGEALFQQNGRLRVHRELQRRNGYAGTNFAPQSSPILAIFAGNVGGGTPVPWMGTLTNTPTGTITTGKSPVVLDGGGVVPPIIGDSCVLFDALSDSGTTSELTQLNPPTDSCAGTISVTGIEGSGQGSGNYGYQFDVECFGPSGLLASYSSGCLVNASANYVMPAGTNNVSFDITGNCTGMGTVPGTWEIAVGTP